MEDKLILLKEYKLFINRYEKLVINLNNSYKDIKTRIINNFSDIKLISRVFSTLILFLIIKNPPEKSMHAKIIIKNTFMLSGSSNL